MQIGFTSAIWFELSKSLQKCSSTAAYFEQIFGKLGCVLPREFKTIEEFRVICESFDDSRFDATVHPHRRPPDDG